MILDFLKEILKTDINNLFEDVSIIKNLNNYINNKIKNTNSNTLFIKTGKKEEIFDLNKEKIIDINKFLNLIFKIGSEEIFYLSGNKYKIVNNNLYLDFINNNNNIINIKITLNSFFYQNINSNDIGNLDSIKLIKSNNNIYMYLFFKNTYFKINILDIKIYIKL